MKQIRLSKIPSIKMMPFAIMLFLSALISSHAQAETVLDKDVSVAFNKTKLSSVLSQLENQADVHFIYSSDVIDIDRRVSINTANEKLGEVLKKILAPEDVTFRTHGNKILLSDKKSISLANRNINYTLPAILPPVRGKVVDANGEEMPGVSVTIKNTSRGTQTGVDGTFSLDLQGDETLVFSFIGFESKEVDVSGSTFINVVLVESANALSEIIVTGTRSGGRTRLDSPVPVDVIDMKTLIESGAQVNLTQILNYVAPSFSSNTQTISDGTDHIDPASLRGLGPDQVLVLINGKRRHTSSLVNVNGTFGRGSVGTDLNTIPAAAIERIEILRDGAAAQYGSDAIAGVINIVLKKSTGTITGSLTAGGNMTNSDNLAPNAEDSMDGKSIQLALNYGIPLGDKGGYVNMTGSFDDRGYTNRMKSYGGQIFSGFNNPNYTGSPSDDITESELTRRGLTRSDVNMRVGQSAIRGGAFMANMSLPMNKNTEFYAFGGLSARGGNAAGFYRLPFQERTVTSIYPNGFLPEINSRINDQSLAVGIRGKAAGWNVDFSNTFGMNSFNYLITNTLNASLEASSPTSFNSGGFAFAQNTTNFDLSRKVDVAKGLNIAGGLEFRYENYTIGAGEEASYTNYGLATRIGTNPDGTPILLRDNKGPISTVFGPNGSSRPGGAQVFPGFSPANEVDARRNNIGAYVDLELDATEKWLIGAALRHENYSDFGSTTNWKVSSRYKVLDSFAIRGAVSTGFRAPSLHQQNYNSTSTLFVDGTPFEVGTFSNDSRVAKLLGIPELKQETSTNYSIGFTSNINDKLKLTVDYYNIYITDRVVLTGNFQGGTSTEQDREIGRLLAAANANRANFFVNAIDSRTQGVDIVTSYQTTFGKGSLRADLAATFAQTKLEGPIKTSPQLAGKEGTYFDETSRIFLEAAVPRQKVNLTLNYRVNKFNIFFRNVYFGAVNEATNNVDNQQEFAAKVVSDLSVGYDIAKGTNFTIGANNLFDVYPDLAIPANQSSGRFLYSRRSQQFGTNGRYVFARLNFSF
jgi:iron complex outermembrane receptor protein